MKVKFFPNGQTQIGDGGARIVVEPRLVIAGDGCGLTDYDKLDNDLRQTITLPNAANIDIDFDSAVAFSVEIQQDTTFTFSNVRENKQIKLILKGDHAVTLTGVNTSDVNYDGARWNVIIIEATLIESNLTLKAVSWV